MKFLIRRASQFFDSNSGPPCNGAVLEEMKYIYDGRELVEKVWTMDISENLREFLFWVELVGGRVVIEKDGIQSSFYVLTIYDYWIE